MVLLQNLAQTHEPPGRCPTALTRSVQLRNGITVTLRPIRPEDEAAEQDLFNRLSPYSRYLRLHASVKNIPPQLLERLTHLDFDHEMALAAAETTAGGERLLGVARYTILPGTRTCEFAIAVADEWQGSGLARQLMIALMEVARDYHRLDLMQGTTLPENRRMLGLAHALGFEADRDPEDAHLVLMRKALDAPPPAH